MSRFPLCTEDGRSKPQCQRQLDSLAHQEYAESGRDWVGEAMNERVQNTKRDVDPTEFDIGAHISLASHRREDGEGEHDRIIGSGSFVKMVVIVHYQVIC